MALRLLRVERRGSTKTRLITRFVTRLTRLSQTVRTQFYQILLNKALVQVQEESVNLLQSQLEDQKSRYEAGTVPQFNVLQAEGTLENQIPQLIAARNNYFIAQVTLARTLGIPATRQYTTDNPLPILGELNLSADQVRSRLCTDCRSCQPPVSQGAALLYPRQR